MVKRLPNWLKIGPQAGFGPNFTVELEAGFRKKFGLAYSAVWSSITVEHDTIRYDKALNIFLTIAVGNFLLGTPI